MLKIGIVGCGKIARKHINGYAKLKGIKLAISDIDSSAREFAKASQIQWYDDVEKLIQDPYVDAIDICTPTPSHAQLITQALAGEKPVFCEKPLTDNLKDCQWILKEAERFKTFVMVGFLYRFHPVFSKIKEILEKGVIGNPHFSILRLGGKGSASQWKHKIKQGGGAANEMLTHMLDLAVWYFGDMQKIQPLHSDLILKERKIGEAMVGCDAADTHLLQMQSETGVCVYCQSDLISPSYMNYIEVHGSNGSIFGSILDSFPTTVFCNEARDGYHAGLNTLNLEKVDLFVKQLQHFVDCVKSGTNPRQNTIQDSLLSVKILSQLQ